MKKFFSARKLNIILSVSAIFLMWLVWIISYYSVKNDYIIPSFSATVKSFFLCFAESGFWIAFCMTMLRTFAAFAVSFASAALLAALSVSVNGVSAFLKPIMVFLRTVPTLAVILVLLVWTNREAAPVAVTFLVLFPMIYSQLTAAADGVDKKLLQMVKVYGIKRSDVIRKIYLPQISVSVFSQTGANISLGLKIMISAEVLSLTYRSLGGLMQSARGYLEMPRLAALTLVAVLAGLLIDAAFSQLKRINAKWLYGEKNAH